MRPTSNLCVPLSFLTHLLSFPPSFPPSLPPYIHKLLCRHPIAMQQRRPQVCVPLPRQVLNVDVGRGALSLEVLREGGREGGRVSG